MDTTWTFNSARRWKHAMLLIALGAVMALPVALLALNVHAVFWAGMLMPAWIVWRGVAYLTGGKEALTIDARGMTRSGTTVSWTGAELELRTAIRADALKIEQVILWPPVVSDSERTGVGFDDSLDRFEDAIRALTARVPEMRIRVSTATERDLQDDRREQVIAPYRPSSAERALLELGRPSLLPPSMRN